MWRMRWRPALVAALVLAACGSSEAAAPETVADVGVLPGPLPSGPNAATTVPATTLPAETTEGTRQTSTTSTTAATRDDRPVTGPIGRITEGNRLLMIGDSILASTAERYSGEMCARLVPLGWAVELNAEEGREIDFGLVVLGRRLSAGWDAAVVFLGNNYAGPPEQFARDLGRILRMLEPRPVVLVTVSEWAPQQAEVNFIIRSAAAQRDDVRVVEWMEATARDEDLLISDDLHPSDQGRPKLVSMIASALGRPADERVEPRCLPTSFTDDSDY